MLKEIGHVTLRSFLGYLMLLIIFSAFYLVSWSTINIVSQFDQLNITEISKIKATEGLLQHSGLVFLLFFAIIGLLTVADKLGGVFLSQIRPKAHKANRGDSE